MRTAKKRKEKTRGENRMKTEKNIPYKIYLDEQEMPKKWYNVRADMKNKPAPLLNPGTLQPRSVAQFSAMNWYSRN